MKWTFKGKVSTPGTLKRPGFFLDATFKKWLNYVLVEAIDEEVSVSITTVPPAIKKKKKKAKKVVKKPTKKKKE